VVHQASGLCRATISLGLKDLEGESLPVGRSRHGGGGRKKNTTLDSTLLPDLKKCVKMSVKGDPMNLLQWVSKSTRHIATHLNSKGHTISHTSVKTLLNQAGYTLQSNVKSKDETGGNSLTEEERDHQFEHIAATATDHIQHGDPVISVDTKKKELIGPYKNSGKKWLPKGQPIEVNGHDFGDRDENGNVKRAIPYGVYNPEKNDGYVTVGITHDTSEFAVGAIRNWWTYLGKQQYPNQKRLLITPDAGGSNGYRVKLWKKELQQFANESGLTITVCHFPRGTSKWNKIEHKLFSFISMNWKGHPLISLEVIISLIVGTTTTSGLKVYASLDTKNYKTKQIVSDQEMKHLNLTTHDFHPELNYTIHPQ